MQNSTIVANNRDRDEQRSKKHIIYCIEFTLLLLKLLQVCVVGIRD